jgi:hypothetical protein
LPVPTPSDLNFNITVTIPKDTTSYACTYKNTGIHTLLEIKSIHDPEADIDIGISVIDVTINGVDGNTAVDIFF